MQQAKVFCSRDLTEQTPEFYKGYMFVLTRKLDSVVALNETAQFLLSHCNGKDLQEVVNELIEACVDGCELDPCEVYKDCEATLEKMMQQGLVDVISTRDQPHKLEGR